MACNSNRSLEITARLAQEAGDALKEIVKKVDVVTSMVHQISTVEIFKVASVSGGAAHRLKNEKPQPRPLSVVRKKRAAV